MLQLTVDKQTVIPVHEQIKNQIRLALAIGELKPGDYLPSIRRADSKLNVGLATIRRAYEELADAGIVTLERGRGAFVSKDASTAAADSPIEQFEGIFQFLSSDLKKRKLVPSAFARFLFSRMLQTEQKRPSIVIIEESTTLTNDYVEQLGEAWQLPVAGMTVAELKAATAEKRDGVSCLLTDYYVQGLVKSILHHRSPLLIPLDVEIHPIMNADLGALSRDAHVALVLENSEYDRKAVYIGSMFEKAFHNNHLQFETLRESEIVLPKLLGDKKYARVYVGNRIWDDLDAETRGHRRIRRPRFRITDECMKRAWGLIGVI
ncbi:MAG TPA: GntR family transcriptional regulator [Terracidiphilus sp.]|nr:GntR family transcriptional regulator [Terracidiphilus sp.]